MQHIEAGPDLGQAIDASYGDGPAHRSLEPVLRAGSRIRRRRRVLQATAVAGTAVVALSAVSTLTPDLLRGGDVEVVARPSATAPPAVTSSSTPSPIPAPSEASVPEVTFGEGEQLSAQPPAVIVSQTADVELGPRFAGADDRTAVAEVSWQGERWYVLARQIDRGPAEYIPVAATKATPTLADFLAEAKDRYAEGTGLR